jgi:hypothetical protein
LNRNRFGILISTAAVMLAGCGGSSNNSTLPSLYAGSWSGTWSGPLANDGGALTFAVTSDGSVSGTMARSGNLSGAFGGVINNTGRLTATSSFPSSGNFVITGQVVLSAGAMSGSFSYSWLGSEYQGTFSETSQSSTSSGTGAGG